MERKDVIVGVLATFCLSSLLFAAVPSSSQTGPKYDPWLDSNDDGIIDIFDAIRLAGVFGTSGTPLTKAAIEYDSGWINITDKCGQYYNIIHSLNSTDIMVDIQGKTVLDGPIHQRYLGLTGYMHGWSNTYGRINPHVTARPSLVQTKDNGFGFVGREFGLRKTDANGILQWEASYPVLMDIAEAIVETPDSGFALAGFGLAKIYADGTLEWNNTYEVDGGSGLFESLILSDDGGFVLGGHTSFLTSWDAWLVKTDNSGNLLWSRTYGGVDGEGIVSVVQEEDGGYTLLAYTTSYGAGGYDFWLLRTDPDGNLQKTKTYGGPNDDMPGSLIKTSDGGYAILGSTGPVYERPLWLVKLDALWTIEWSKTFNPDNVEYEPRSLIQTCEGGYAFVSHNLLVKTDSKGNQQWNKTFENIPGWTEGFTSLIQTSDGALALAGTFVDSVKEEIFPLLLRIDTEFGATWECSDPNTIAIYRGQTDPYWNFVRVRIWKPKTP